MQGPKWEQYSSKLAAFLETDAAPSGANLRVSGEEKRRALWQRKSHEGGAIAMRAGFHCDAIAMRAVRASKLPSITQRTLRPPVAREFASAFRGRFRRIWYAHPVPLTEDPLF